MTDRYSLTAAGGGTRLEGRVILVTGAAGGIGSAVSLACARQGATVLLLDRNRRGIDQLYDRIVAEGLPEPAGIHEDLARLDGARAAALADQVADNYPGLHALVHAAQDDAPLAPLEHYPVDTFRRLLDTQVTAAFVLCRTLLPLLRAAADPRIVLTSGAAGRRPRAYHGAAAIGWCGADMLAGILDQEFEADGTLRAFAIDPGSVDTTMHNRWYPGRSAADLPKPGDVADAYVFLVSAESRDFAGPLCTLDGGVLEGAGFPS